MKIRKAGRDDSAGLARIQVDSYLSAYAGILPTAYLEHFTYDEQEQDWREWFAANGNPLYVCATGNGEIIGYALGRPNAQELPPHESELVSLHVRREYRKQGLGRRLMAAVSRELLARGCASLFLWTLADNPACRFYESLGGRRVAEKAWVNNKYFETNIYEVAFGWLDIQCLIRNAASTRRRSAPPR